MNATLSFVLMGILFLTSACSQKTEKYIELNPNLGREKIVAIRTGNIINGMTSEEVKLVLGEPTFIDRSQKESELGKWIYRNVSGIKAKDAYHVESSFPSGIGYVVPLNYECVEILIDFKEGKVCRIEKVLRF